jgi:sugar transferase (PEP-CTERM/EpsH1 system associated)
MNPVDRKPILLAVLPRVPYPLEKGDRLRAYHQLKSLAAHYRIVLFALNEEPIHPEAHKQLSLFCEEIHIHNLSLSSKIAGLLASIVSGKPFQVGYYYHVKAVRALQRLVERYPPQVSLFQLVRTGPYLLPGIPGVRVMDFMDCLSSGLKRRASQSQWWMRWIIKVEANRLEHYEKRLFERFDVKTLISDADRMVFPHPGREAVHIWPNGVDFDYFAPIPETDKKFDVVFSGNMQYPPNREAARFLVQEIMPLVWKRKPNSKLVLAGTSPPASVRELAGLNVTVTGWVPDLRPYFHQSKMMVAPMLFGSGLQNKLLESMAMNLPCLTTPLANNALGAEPGKEILLFDEPQQAADTILSLLDDAVGTEQLAAAGRLFVLSRFNWSELAQRFVSWIKPLH